MNEWRGENFLMPQYNQFEPPILIEGSVKIGSYPDDYEREIEEVVRWCYCLTEISKILTESEWEVTFGDERLVYDLTVGFKLDKIPFKLHEELKPNCC